MFNNIGNKIKTLAEIISWVGIIFSVVIGGILLFSSYAKIIGIIVLVVGVLGSWIGSFLLYGFGELINSTLEIKKAICKPNEVVPPTKVISKKNIRKENK